MKLLPRLSSLYPSKILLSVFFSNLFLHLNSLNLELLIKSPLTLWKGCEILINNKPYLYSWRSVNEDDEDALNYLEQEIHTNSSTTSYTIENLQPYTVYSFQVSAVNHVGRSRPGRNSYPSITLRESK